MPPPSGPPSLLATSDLHVGHNGNREVVERIRPRTEGDWLLLAGDIADTVADLEWALRLLTGRFARVIWTPGNHELWTRPDDAVQLRGQARYQHLIQVCRGLGVLTPEDPYQTWRQDGEDLTVVPLFLLYDYSWRPEGTTLAQALLDARATKVVCTDEFFLHPDPYPSRQAWCEQRLRVTLDRLAELPSDRRTVLVSHWPLHRAPTRILRWPHFAMWCGLERTHRWHQEYRAAVAVYGHLHIPLTIDVDGVRFEEVSLGYPREWRPRMSDGVLPDPVRRILPADLARIPIDHRDLIEHARARRAASG
jgi:3',5'-cyclic AMP phosphodiesterase CpdA